MPCPVLCYLIACIVLLNRITDGVPIIQSDQMICAEYVANGLNSPAPTDEAVVDEETSADFFVDEDSSESNAAAGDADPETGVPPSAEPQHPVGTVQCSAGQQFCYSVWKLDAIGNATIIRQGCWQSDEQMSACQSERCVSGSPNAARSTTSHRFCCCSGSMCNQNTTIIEAIHHRRFDGQFDDADDDDELEAGAGGPFTASQIASLWRSPLVWTCLAVTGALVVAVGALLALSSGKKYEPELAPLAQALNDADAGPGPGYSSTAQCVDNLRLCSMIGRGRYGTVWKGIVNDRPVAVKIFPAQHRQYFVNERNIYSLDLMECDSLLAYYGSDTRRTMTDQVEHLLVLSLAPHGCLQDWLIENTCSFAVFTRMAKSVIRGLCHLHTELRSIDSSGDRNKPCVCHRDLNTRNILVKADLSCCIADFGFALKMYGSRYEWKGEIALAETKSVAEVGTLRYMAPEVLEGAVNLRECETALKQIDVYALGLVLWELCTRCADWYPTASADQPTPPYRAPYEAEVGKHPTFEHMQILVSRHKVRPSFAADWGGAAASARLARETCEDCWDADSEARLTALCAEERMHELSVLGPTAQSSRPISPTAYASDGSKPPVPQSQLHHEIMSTTAAPPPHCNMYSPDNVTTAIITPPNQMIPQPSSASTGDRLQVITITSRGIGMSDDAGDFAQRNPNNFGDDGANSVEELLSNSASASLDSVAMAGGAANPIHRSVVGSRGWYDVRTLIQQKIFKRTPPTHRTRERTDSMATGGPLGVVRSPQSSAPLAVQLRPCNLVLEQQQQRQQQQQQNQPNTEQLHHDQADRSIDTNIADEHSASGARINHPVDGFNAAAVQRRTPRIVISKSATTVLQPANTYSAETNIGHGVASPSLADLRQMKRQRSLDMFHEVFGEKGSIERLRDPAQRVKTPGDVPAAVRKMRASKTLSLYDDRMMDPATLTEPPPDVIM